MRRLALTLTILALPGLARAQIAEVLKELGPDVRTYNDHIVTLANPFMEGRVPGSHGMQVAKDYVEFWFKKARLLPAFKNDEGESTWRQQFPVGHAVKAVTQRLEAGGVALEAGTDFSVLGFGSSGKVEGKVVFVGYGIEKGPDGYDSFAEDDDLTGKIALVYRFEPVDAAGKSRWAARGWSNHSGIQAKLRAVKKHGAAAILLANTPGANDPRIHELYAPGGGGRRTVGCPVLHLSLRGLDRLLEAVAGKKPKAVTLRKLADAGRAVVELDAGVAIAAEVRRERLMAENIAGVIPGSGALKHEVVIIGGHLDHLGMGNFGSREGPGKLHPGADDNASGTAAVLMIADKVKRAYDAMPPDKPRRTIMCMAFSGEESGLVGSSYYVKHPVVPLERHALMINFDMIGRITKRRLAVYGSHSAKGLDAWLEPFFADSGLDIKKPASSFGGSDHLPFMAKRIPYLFSIITPFHNDYHTSRDKSWKINRVDAVRTMAMYTRILIAAGTRTEPFVWAKRKPRRTKPRPQPAQPAAQPSRRAIRVRFGVMPGSYEEGEKGILVGNVSEDSPAAKGGIKADDRLVSWNGAKIGDVRDWMRMLMKHKPGDIVKVGVERAGKVIELKVKLEKSGR